MILDAIGGGLVSGAVLVAGLAHPAAASPEPDPVYSAVCDYAPQTSGTEKDADELGLSARQTGNARTIVDTAVELELPRRAAEIALATAFQESRLDNDAVSAGGRSFGLFQQTPAAGWGTRKQVTTPSHAARSFYKRLVGVRGWTTMPLTKAAAIVQQPRKDLRGKYAKHEPLAQQLVAGLWTSGEEMEKVKLTAKEETSVETGIETAAGLGIPRETVIANLTDGLREKYGEEETAITVRKRAEDIFDTITGRLCVPDESDDQAPDRNDDQAPGESDDQTPGEVDGHLTGDAGSATASTAVSAALAQRGIPYSYGGGGPAGPGFGIGRGAKTRGFDCSGLTEYAWSKAGIQIGGTTYEQVKKGRKIARSEVRPGDLVFYETDSSRPGPDHVGLAVSGQEMVNAPRTGTVVRLDAIDRQGFVAAVRPS